MDNETYNSCIEKSAELLRLVVEDFDNKVLQDHTLKTVQMVIANLYRAVESKEIDRVKELEGVIQSMSSVISSLNKENIKSNTERFW